MNDDRHDQRRCWIDTIDPADAAPELAAMYAEVGAVHNKIHNLYRAFSLQPAPLLPADRHYRAVLHNESNHSAPWFLELLASQVDENVKYSWLLRGMPIFDELSSQKLDQLATWLQPEPVSLKT